MPEHSNLSFIQRRALLDYLDNQERSDRYVNVTNKNQLINTLPTLRARPFRGSEATAYDSASASVSLDGDRYDPSTGLAMAKVTIPISDTNYHNIDYLDLDPWQMQPDDVWMFSVYIEDRVDELEISVLATDAATISGIEFRTMRWSGDILQKGYNLLTALHKETYINNTTYGTVGTNGFNLWTNSGNVTDESQSRSIRIRCRMTSGQGAEFNVHFGAIHTAPAGWAKGAVMWFADDAIEEFIDKAAPVIQSYGWPVTVAPVATYSADPGISAYSPMEKVKELMRTKDAEIWSHLRRHENMDTETTAGKTKAFLQAQRFFANSGMTTASVFGAWPFGAYDDEAISLAKSNGYKLMASIYGNEINPYMAGINPFYLNRFLCERSNSWQVDSILNGGIKRGCGMIPYMHWPVDGGATSDTYPESGKFYLDHLRRWCDLVAQHEENGRCIVTTPLRYFKMCGIDPYVHPFAE